MNIFKLRNFALMLIAAMLLVGGIAVGFFLSEKNKNIPVTTLAYSGEYEETRGSTAKERTTGVKTFSGSVVEKKEFTVSESVSFANPYAPTGPVTPTQNHTQQNRPSSSPHPIVTEPKITKAQKPATTKNSYPTIHIKLRQSTALDLSKIPSGSNITFRSSVPSVAGVDDNGIITGRSTGESLVYVTYKQNMKNYTITYLVIVD